MSDLSARRISADSCRTERVAYLNQSIIRLYTIGRKADAQEFEEAQDEIRSFRSLLDRIEATLDDESAARQRERSGEAVHGEDPEAPEVA